MLDVILVVYEKPQELQECVRRIFETTDVPFRLIMVVNDQTEASAEIVSRLQREHSNVQALFNASNKWCGPASNQALELVTAPYAVYLCARECFLFNRGWAQEAVDYMEAHPRVAIAGSLSSSPAYATGRLYKIKLPVWHTFRRKDYVETRLDDEFAHVQGGFFILRMEVARRIGFFNPAILHNYIDVEYSYYVEACGFELGELPCADIRHINTLPRIEGYRPYKRAYHPLTLAVVNEFEKSRRSYAEAGRKCGTCGWEGTAFRTMVAPRYRREEAICPQCGSLERHRALYEYLRLLGGLEGKLVLDIAPVPIFERLFKEMGARYVSADLESGRGQIRMNLCASPFGRDKFDLIICYHVLEHIPDDLTAIAEIRRMLKPGGRAYIQVPQHRYRRRTVEYAVPDSFCHDHVRDPGLDYYDRLEHPEVRIRIGDLGSAFPLAYGVLRGMSNATGETAIMDKM